MTHFIHENEYRGSKLLTKLAETRVVLCGAGALGSLLADNLIRQGFKRLRVIDRDRVEEHNINTQLYGLTDVGARKAEILRNRLFRSVQVEIDAVAQELTTKNCSKLLRNADVIIDAFDNSASRRLVQTFTREHSVACLHVGLFTDYCEAMWGERYDVPKDVMGDVCEYPLARNIVMLAVTIASEEIVRFISTGEQRDWSATLGDFAVTAFGDALPAS